MIDVSNTAPKIIDLKGESMIYIDGKPRSLNTKREFVLELLDVLGKYERDNQLPFKKSESSIIKRNLDYVKKNNAIPKTELRGLYNAINFIWNKVYK